MNDVLAKPFTKDGMIRILKKHLPHLLKNPPAPGSSMDDIMSAGEARHAAAAVATYSNAGGVGLTHMGAPVKYETTPIQSPATTSSWHSPSQMTQQTSPHTDGGGFLAGSVGSGQTVVLTPGGSQRQTFHHGSPPHPPPPQLGNPTPMVVADDRPEKRQRVYGPAPTFSQQ